MLYLQGGRDTTIPEAGGESYDHYLYESSAASVGAFAAGNGCAQNATAPFVAPFDAHPPHACTARVGCERGAKVVFCDYPTQTHGFWPTWGEEITWWFLRTQLPQRRFPAPGPHA